MLGLPWVTHIVQLGPAALGHRRAVGLLAPFITLAVSRLGFHGSRHLLGSALGSDRRSPTGVANGLIMRTEGPVFKATRRDRVGASHPVNRCARGEGFAIGQGAEPVRSLARSRAGIANPGDLIPVQGANSARLLV